jgi:hypothetical protein
MMRQGDNTGLRKRQDLCKSKRETFLVRAIQTGLNQLEIVHNSSYFADLGLEPYLIPQFRSGHFLPNTSVEANVERNCDSTTAARP